MPENPHHPLASAGKIVIQKDGPYLVTGPVQLVRKVQVVTEHGEPIAWQKTEMIQAGQRFELCRCGLSQNKPFCDGTHEMIGFDGTEAADTRPTEARQYTLPGGTRLVARKDQSLCMEAGFCANRLTSIVRLMPKSDDPSVRSQIIAMVERCPSGSLTYSIEGEEIEPDLPAQIAVVTEMTDSGPIMGPLWVTGCLPVERADGKPLQVRNRVTLCRCGLSRIKPLCDGEHRRKHVVE
jgi:CDGSH-type Zn-finger protein